MDVQDLLAYLRSLGWKVWALMVATAVAILVFCGWVMGSIVIVVCGVALIPAVRLGVRFEAERRQRSALEPKPDK